MIIAALAGLFISQAWLLLLVANLYRRVEAAEIRELTRMMGEL